MITLNSSGHSTVRNAVDDDERQKKAISRLYGAAYPEMRRNVPGGSERFVTSASRVYERIAIHGEWLVTGASSESSRALSSSVNVARTWLLPQSCTPSA